MTLRIPAAIASFGLSETRLFFTGQSRLKPGAVKSYRPASAARTAASLAPFVMQGAAGSQARAILAQALINARRRGFEVIATSRDPSAFTRAPLHHLDQNGALIRKLKLAPEHQPALRVHTSRENASLPKEAHVFNSVSAHALAASLKGLPPGVKIFTGQNGVPTALPPDQEACRQHYISTIATAIDKQGSHAEVLAGGALSFDARTPDRAYLEATLGGGDLFDLQFVPDIRVTQWRKVAFNVVNNTLCTVFDTSFGTLFERTRQEPRFMKLVRGMIIETCQVAAARGVPLGEAEEILEALGDIQQTWPAHRTSLHAALLRGDTIENPWLAGAIAREGQRLGVPAPLCAAAAQTLEMYTQMRDLAGRDAAARFYDNHREVVRQAGEALLAIAEGGQAGLPPSEPGLK
jgi:ketopantoate reductase